MGSPVRVKRNNPWRLMMKTVIIAICLFIGLCGGGINSEVSARKVSTTLKAPSKNNVKKKKRASDRWELIHTDDADSIKWKEKVVFAGFDKQLGASTESFHVSNHTDFTISQLEIDLTYYDEKGRMLHKRTETLNIIIPPGETRKVDIKSFDKQHSFYYSQSNRPSRSAIPFTVSISLQSFLLQSP